MQLMGRLMAMALLLMPCIVSGAGTVTHLSGTLSAIRADGSKVLLSTRSEVKEGDTLTTAHETYARVKFNDGAEVVLRPSTVFKIDRFNYDEAKPKSDNFFVSLIRGGMRAVSGAVGSRSRDQVGYATASATIGIRGTHFGALSCQGDCAAIPTVTGRPLDDGLHLDVVAGAIAVKNQGGEQLVGAGQFAYVKDAATPARIVPPNEGVRVTMPPAISQNKSDGRTLDKNNSDDQCTVK